MTARRTGLIALVAALGLAVAAPPCAASGLDARAGDAAARKKDKKDEKGKEGEAKAADDKSKEKDKDKPFDEVVKEYTSQDGLFTVWKKDEKYLLELKPDQYDKEFMISVTRVSGVGQSGLLGNQMLMNYPAQFHKVGKNVQLVIKNLWFRSDTDKALREAVDRSFSDSLIGVTKLESAPHPDRKSDLVDVTPLFIRDIERVEQFTDEQLKSGYKLDKDNSYFGGVKAFPRNVNFETVVHFANPRSNIFGALPDQRSMFLHYTWTLSAPPEGEFMPRIADDRVGHFVETMADYSSDRIDAPWVRYVDRWKLEKSDPSAAVSAPKEPIVYYLDRSIPKEYRKAVAEGALLWNKAFEKIGFKDAVVVKEAPDDPSWDTADVRYSSIRWFVSTDAAFAIGPSMADPRSGRLYDADIGFSESMTRLTRREYRELADPLTMIRSMIAETMATAGASGQQPLSMLGRDASRLCTIGSEAYRQASFGWGILAARGAMAPGSAEEEQYMHDFLVSVTAHEVGHTLGLRHNYRASSLHSLADLQDASKTASTGLTGSVMEYTPVNIAPPGSKQGQYWQTTLGPYDYWAIEYAYKPIAAKTPEEELPELRKIASRVAQPSLAFSTDDDAGFGPGPVGMDPRDNVWDIGSDPIGFYTGRVAIARELWKGLPDKVMEEGDGYQIVRRAFNQGIGEFPAAIVAVTKYVGGVMQNRDHVGDPDGRRPYVPIPAADQRRALAFLNAHLFAADAFEFKPELVDAMSRDRFFPLVGFVPNPRQDYPIHETVLTLQDLALTRLYHPVLLGRVQDADTRVPNGTDHLSMAEMFATLRDGIWTELRPAAARGPADIKVPKVEVNSYRRALQRSHLQRIARLAMGMVPNAPDSAATLARADLTELKGRIGSALKVPGLDPATRAHLAESAALIDQTLDAKMIRTI